MSRTIRVRSNLACRSTASSPEFMKHLIPPKDGPHFDRKSLICSWNRQGHRSATWSFLIVDFFRVRLIRLATVSFRHGRLRGNRGANHSYCIVRDRKSNQFITRPIINIRINTAKVVFKVSAIIEYRRMAV
jgi:hypothetical protein